MGDVTSRSYYKLIHCLYHREIWLHCSAGARRSDAWVGDFCFRDLCPRQWKVVAAGSGANYWWRHSEMQTAHEREMAAAKSC